MRMSTTDYFIQNLIITVKSNFIQGSVTIKN